MDTYKKIDNKTIEVTGVNTITTVKRYDYADLLIQRARIQDQRDNALASYDAQLRDITAIIDAAATLNVDSGIVVDDAHVKGTA